MKVARYEILNDASRFVYLHEVSDYYEEGDGYIRVSDIVDADFVMVDDALIIPRKVDALRAEKAIQAAEFDEKIAKLLSITHQSEEEVAAEEHEAP